MALPTIADCVRCTFNWTSPSFSQTFHNVLHFDVSSGASLNQLATNIDTAMNNNMAEGTAGNYRVSSIDLLPLDGVSGTTQYNVTGMGPASTADFTPALAAIISLRTGLRGKEHRGRIYIPAIAEASATNGVIAPAAVTALGTGWVAFINSVGGATPSTPLVVASYKLSTFDPVTQVVTRSVGGTIRRRQESFRP